MSLFDVLKYPLSTPPTREELEALPIDVINETYNRLNTPTVNASVLVKNIKILNLYLFFRSEQEAKMLVTTIRKVLEELP